MNPTLLYVYSEPVFWSKTQEPVDPELISAHAEETKAFAKDVAGDEVRFRYCTYQNLMSRWQKSELPAIRAHTQAVMEHFSP